MEGKWSYSTSAFGRHCWEFGTKGKCAWRTSKSVKEHGIWPQSLPRLINSVILGSVCVLMEDEGASACVFPGQRSLWSSKLCEGTYLWHLVQCWVVIAQSDEKLPLIERICNVLRCCHIRHIIVLLCFFFTRLILIHVNNPNKTTNQQPVCKYQYWLLSTWVNSYLPSEVHSFMIVIY